MIPVILLFQADSDIQAAFNRYEEFQTGRGEIFMRHVDLALGFIAQHPEIGPFYRKPYRRMLVKDFPYGIFYQPQATRIIVCAVMDLRQEEASIRKRLMDLGTNPPEGED